MHRVVLWIPLAGLVLLLPPATGAPVAPTCQDLSRGLVAWWTGDSTLDDVAGTNDGNPGSPVAYAPGRAGNAFQCSSTRYVIVDDHPSLRFPDGLTAAVWLRPTNYAHPYAVFSDWSDGPIDRAWGFGLVADGSGRPVALLSAFNGHSDLGGLVAGTGLPLGAWSHMVFTFDRVSGAMAIYVNGVLDTSGTSTSPGTPIRDAAGPLGLGWQSNAWTDGDLDDAMLWDRALSAAEVAALYDAGNGPACRPVCVPAPAGVVGWWGGNGDGLDDAGDHDVAGGAFAFAPGMVGPAFDFDGTGHAEVPDAPTLATPDGLTVDAWVHPRSHAGFVSLVSKWDDLAATRSWVLKFANDGSGRLRLDLVQAGGAVLAVLEGTRVVPLHRWTHVAGTYDRASGEVRLYQDGDLEASLLVGAPGPAIATSTAPVWIGSVNGSSGPENLDGLLDEVEVFTRALSAAEVSELFVARSAGKCAGCAPDRTPPVVLCPGEMRVECSSPAGTPVTLPLPTVTDGCDPSPVVTFLPASGSLFAPGRTSVTCTATDATGNATSCAFDVVVEDTTPPQVACTPTRPLLWPAGNGLLDVGLAITATDACGGTPSTVLTVWSDEPSGVAPYTPDGSWAAGRLRLRAERATGAGANGRIYLVGVRATDPAGLSSVACCTVVVPLNLTASHLTALLAEAAAVRAAFLANPAAPPPGWHPIVLP